MIKIAFIAPDDSQVDLIQTIYQQQSLESLVNAEPISQYDFSLHVAARYENIPQQAFDADIIIARGIVATQVKRAYHNTAVVDVPIGSELVTTIYQAVAKHGPLPIAISGSFNVIYSAHGLGDVLGLDIKTYLHLSNERKSLREGFQKMLRDGRKIIICGANMHEIAASADCIPVRLGMSRESIWQAISEAKLGAVIKHRERERAEQFTTVLNYAYDGILATDAGGKITVFNAAAEEVLGIPSAQALGKTLENLPGRETLLPMFRGKADYMDKFIAHNGEMLSVNRVSIRLGGDFAGYVFTMQKCSAVQKKENRIRQQLYAKGHVAKYTFDDIIGSSPAVTAAKKKAANFARVNSNIMILGETGTGKEVFAQSIHNQSERRSAPFVAINCAALSKSLLESELFGYVDGAFTGAAKGGKPGIFEIAHTGTIFLDEISEIPLDLQGRLLRVLQERQIMRLGDDKIIPIDVRTISATNKPLLEEVRRNAFRRDLFYRLNVLTLALPPLNRRGADCLRLASLFLDEYCVQFGKQPLLWSEEASRALVNHTWEGNIRELRNVCEYLAVISENDTITLSALEEAFGNEPEGTQEFAESNFQQEIQNIEKQRIAKALQQYQGDRTATAKNLGMSRTTLWRKIKEYDLYETKNS